MIYTKYFVVNLTFLGCYSWLPEEYKLWKLCCIISETKDAMFEGCDDYVVYVYNCIFFHRRNIKKTLTKSSLLTMFDNWSHFLDKYSETYSRSLTKAEIIEVIKKWYSSKGSFMGDLIRTRVLEVCK